MPTKTNTMPAKTKEKSSPDKLMYRLLVQAETDFNNDRRSEKRFPFFRPVTVSVDGRSYSAFTPRNLRLRPRPDAQYGAAGKGSRNLVRRPAPNALCPSRTLRSLRRRLVHQRLHDLRRKQLSTVAGGD